jgi:hypothetical protein
MRAERPDDVHAAADTPQPATQNSNQACHSSAPTMVITRSPARPTASVCWGEGAASPGRAGRERGPSRCEPMSPVVPAPDLVRYA